MVRTVRPQGSTPGRADRRPRRLVRGWRSCNRRGCASASLLSFPAPETRRRFRGLGHDFEPLPVSMTTSFRQRAVADIAEILDENRAPLAYLTGMLLRSSIVAGTALVRAVYWVSPIFAVPEGKVSSGR